MNYLATLVFASAIVVILGVLAGGTGIIYAERQAKIDAEQRGKVVQFLEAMIGGINPEVAKGRDTSLLRQVLENNVGRIETDFAGQPELQAELEATMAKAYWSIGDYEKSATLLRGVAERLKKLPDNELSLAQTLNDLAVVLNRQGKSAEAEAMHRDVLARRKKLLGPNHEDVGESLNNLAAVLWGQGKVAEAEPLYREALALWRKLLGNEHQLIYTALNNLAQDLADQGKSPEAETMFADALAMERKLLGNEHPDVASTLNNLAVVQADQGKLANAETTHREALAMQRKLLNNEHPELAKSLHNLSRVLRDEDKLVEAESFEREALAMRKKLLGNDHPDTQESLNSLAQILQGQNRLVEAESNCRECLAGREKNSPDDWRTFNTQCLLGDILLAQQKYAEAEPFLLTGYEGMKQREGKISADSRGSLKATIGRLVQLNEALGHAEKADEWKKKLEQPDMPFTGTNSAAARKEK